MSAAWIGLIGALGGVIVTGLIGLATALLSHRWQEDDRRVERLGRLRDTRAQLRRDAYTRYLIAVQTMGETVQTRVAEDLTEEPMERLRKFRLANAKPFGEFDAAERHVRLLAGTAVLEALDVYGGWVITQTGISFNSANPAASDAFDDWAEAERPLINAMRVEQEGDLLHGEAEEGDSA